MQRHEIYDLSSRRAVWSVRPRVGLEPGVSMREIAEEHAMMLQELFDEPVNVVGVSTGGSLALQLTADHPELVHRLVLVSSAHRLSDHGRATQRRIAMLLRENRSRRAAALFLGNTGANRFSRAVLAIMGWLAPRMVVGRDDSDLLVVLDAENTFDLTSSLARITTPTLVTGGQHDRFYTSALFATAHAGLPNAQLEIYPRGGHIGTLANPTLAKRILSFLDRPLP